MKKTSRFLLVMIVFYIAVAVVAVAYFDRGRSFRSLWGESDKERTAQVEQTVIAGTEEDLPTIEPVVPVDVSEDEDDYAADEEPEVSEEEELPVIEPMDDQDVRDVEDTENDEEAEESSLDEDMALADDETEETQYYSFAVATGGMNLNVRIEPSENAGIISRIPNRTVGYVLEFTGDWSHIVTPDGVIGYCLTDYLKLEKITRDEFPSEYLDQVKTTSLDEPDEESTAP